MPARFNITAKVIMIAFAMVVAGTTFGVSSSRRVRQFPFPLTSEYFPSGWMGDGEQGEKYLSVTKVSVDVAGQNKIATKIVYRPGRSSKRWAGVYWQHPDKNWGQRPGLDLTGAREIAFQARGERGGEVVEFISGGIEGKYPDRFKKSLGDVALTTTWKEFRIDLRNLDLKNVVGALAWSAAAPETGDLVFYIVDMQIR